MAGVNEARLRDLIAAAPDLEVLIVGDLMLDRYVSGRVERVSPEAPVPVVRVEGERSALGGAGNVAANVAALGARCRVVGCVGDDAAGAGISEALAKLGVDTGGLVTTPGRPTTEKTRILARRQQVVRFDVEREDDVESEVSVSVAAHVRAAATDVDAIVVADYNKGVVVAGVVETVRGLAEERSIPWVVDPKRRNFFDFAGATVFKPNAKELEDALGDFIHPDDGEWMEAARRRLACRNLLVTLGERGMALQTEEGTAVRIPVVPRPVYDVSGAGDTVSAVVALALGAGGTPAEAALLANHAAAIEVGKAGVASVSPEELSRHLDSEA